MPADYKETRRYQAPQSFCRTKPVFCAIKQHPEHNYEVGQQGFMKHLPYVSAAKREKYFLGKNLICM